MNIGMCLHPVDPAISDGDHGVSQTQTEHDIFLASTCPICARGVKKTHTHKFTFLISRRMKKFLFEQKVCSFFSGGDVLFFPNWILSDKCKQTPHSYTYTHAHTHTFDNLAIGWVARPILPPGSPRLSLFVGQRGCLRNNLSPTTDSGSDYHGPAP